jgi:thiamine monophosphate kinase
VGEYCARKSIDPLEHILASGEDFELLFTAADIPRMKKLQIFKIGRVEKGKGLYLIQEGKTIALKATGYEHLKTANRR